MGEVKPKVLDDAVIVAGHPRSGTSLACQLVESAGISFPSDFEGDEYNEKGYYEMDLSKTVSKDLMNNAMTEENVKDFNKVIDRLNNVDGVPGLKLVRVPTIFFYKHICDNLKAVFVYRKPEDSKSSMFRRGISQFPVSWAENGNGIISAYENIEKSIIISYESLLKGEAPKKFEKIDLDIDPNVVDSNQRTQKETKVVPTQHEEKIYKTLKQLEEADEEKTEVKSKISKLKEKGKL